MSLTRTAVLQEFGNQWLIWADDHGWHASRHHPIGDGNDRITCPTLTVLADALYRLR